MIGWIINGRVHMVPSALTLDISLLRGVLHYGQRLISTNHIARNQEFGLSTLHTRGQSPKPFVITFWRRRRTLEGSLSRMGMETQTMVERPSVFFIQKSIIDKILAVRLEGLFWARNKVGCSFGFGLWAWPLEASHYDRPSWEAVGVHEQRFGLWTWPLEASHYAWPKAPLVILYWLWFSTHFFGLSTKFGHSIPRPLDFNGHGVKRP
jgi:hypothetical protein